MRIIILFLALLCAGLSSAQVEELVSEEVAEEPLAPSQMEFDPDYHPATAIQMSTRGRYGFYNGSKTVIPLIYEYLPKSFSDFMIAKKDGVFGVINRRNETVLAFEYNELRTMAYQAETSALIAKKNGLYGLIDRQGNILLPLEHKSFNKIHDETYAYENPEGKFGLVDTSGAILQSPRYDYYPGQWYNDHYIAKIEGMFGIINERGKVILPFEYAYLNSNIGPFLIASKEGKMGLIDQDLNVAIPFIYDNIEMSGNNYARVTTDGKTGVLNPEFVEIIPQKYRKIKQISLFNFKLWDAETNSIFIANTLGKVILGPSPGRVLLGPQGVLFVPVPNPDNERVPLGYHTYSYEGKILDGELLHDIKSSRSYFTAARNVDGKLALYNEKAEQITDFVYTRIIMPRKSRASLNSDYKIRAQRGADNVFLSLTGKEMD